MIKLITGKKGTGKTKILIDAIHEAENKSNGNVVAIQKGSALNTDITPKVRLVNIDDYAVAGVDGFYGFVSGVVYRRVQHTLPMMFATLISAMVAGRLVWGAVRFILAGLTGSSFPFSAFLSGALLTAVPGILAQLILIPLIVNALTKAKLID